MSGKLNQSRTKENQCKKEMISEKKQNQFKKNRMQARQNRINVQ